jgi:hypothetical protein
MKMVTLELGRYQIRVNAGREDSEDVANTCLFLASNQSRHVSGVELYVDGGASLLK